MRPAIPSTGPTSTIGDLNNNSGKEHDYSGPASGKVCDDVTGGRPTLGYTSKGEVTDTGKKRNRDKNKKQRYVMIVGG